VVTDEMVAEYFVEIRQVWLQRPQTADVTDEVSVHQVCTCFVFFQEFLCNYLDSESLVHLVAFKHIVMERIRLSVLEPLFVSHLTFHQHAFAQSRVRFVSAHEILRPKLFDVLRLRSAQIQELLFNSLGGEDRLFTFFTWSLDHAERYQLIL
jgi:hypothetical protein